MSVLMYISLYLFENNKIWWKDKHIYKKQLYGDILLDYTDKVSG